MPAEHRYPYQLWWLVARSPTGICLFISELDLLCAPISAQRRFVSCSIITIITFVVFVCLLVCFAHISVYFTFDTMHKLLSILMLKINFSFDHIMTAVFQCVYIIQFFILSVRTLRFMLYVHYDTGCSFRWDQQLKLFRAIIVH